MTNVSTTLWYDKLSNVTAERKLIVKVKVSEEWLQRFSRSMFKRRCRHKRLETTMESAPTRVSTRAYAE